jgi:hypothetical protein
MQTRATLSGQIAGAVLMLWAACTIWLIWHRVGTARPALQHLYFIRWIISDVLTYTPFINRAAAFLPMYADGNWWEMPSFAAWLDGLYGGTFYQWVWRAAIGTNGYYGLGSYLLPLLLLGTLLAWWWYRDPDGSSHIRGLRMINPKELTNRLHGCDTLLKRILTKSPEGFELGQVILPWRSLTEHMLITGNPGSGKSTAMKSLLRQIRASGGIAIVIDPEGEYTEEFYEDGDWVLNPFHPRGRHTFFSPWSELRDDWFTVDASAMAASLVRGKARDANQEFFLTSTRTVIESIFQVARAGNHGADLLKFIGMPRKDLHEALEGTPAYPLIDPKAAEQGSGILGTAVNAIKNFVHLPKREDCDRVYSAYEWVQQRKGSIFMPSRDDIRDALQPLQGLWLDCLIRWLMSAEIGGDQVFLLLDEVAALGHQAQLEKLLTRGRKRGISVILGLQSLSQLRAIYGPEGATTLTASPSTKLIMRVDETEMANVASELIGRHEVERLQMTQLAGLSSFREGVNLSPHRTIETLVLPDEIKMLQPFTGYLCIAGFNRTFITLPRPIGKQTTAVFEPIVTVLPPAADQLAAPRAAEITAQLINRA